MQPYKRADMLKFLITTALASTASVHAAPIVFSTPANGVVGGERVSAQAIFNVIDQHTFTLTLFNLGTVQDAGQLLTNFEFNSNARGLSLANSSGFEVSVADNGTMSTAKTPVPTGWGAGETGRSGAYLLCIICGGGVSAVEGVPPSHAIISATLAPNVNSSIANGDGPHNPFLASGAIFAVTTSSDLLDAAGHMLITLDDVYFSFSTTYGQFLAAESVSIEAVPEPISLMLTGAGLIAIGVMRRRRRKAADTRQN